MNAGETIPIVLASRSPRRRELLSLLVSLSRIRQCPPSSSVEAGFESLHDWDSIRLQLAAIARMKNEDVAAQIDEPESLILAADTVVIVAAEEGRPLVLGQPPEVDDWQTVVREWFIDWYAGRTHRVATAVCMRHRERIWESIVTTRVTFCHDVERWLDWYIATGDPLGKAGGYGIQGAASLFAEKIEGSLSNVIGLPLEAVAEGCDALGIDWREAR